MEIRIKEILSQKRMTVSELAVKVGKSQGVISSVIKRNSCKIDKLSEYAKALNVPVWEMITDKYAITPCDGYVAPTWKEQNRLKELLKEKGLTQVQTASLLDTNQATICSILKQTNLNLSTVEEYSKALGIEPWLLFVSPQEIEEDMARRKGQEPAAVPSATAPAAPQPAAQSPMDDFFGWGNKTTEEIMEEEALLAEQELNEVMKKQATKMIPVLSDGEYRYGNMVLVLKDGKVELKSV